MFGHEKFGAYQKAIEFVAIAMEILDKIPLGYSKLADQFRRAATAVPLNIAEGSGKGTDYQKRHCYNIARGEAMECAAIIDVLRSSKLVELEKAAKAKMLLHEVVSILASICRKKEGRK